MAKATIGIVSSKTMPNSSFKFSTVDKNTIELHSSFNTQLNKITSAYDAFKNSLNVVRKEISNEASNGKKKLDKKKLNNLNSLATRIAKQVKNTEARKTALKTQAQKDTQAIQKAEQSKAWQAAIDEILKDNSLSDSLKQALIKLKSFL